MNNERVTPKNAAKELQMDVLTLRELMKREKLPIGYAVKREGKSKWGFYIYRHLLDQEKERLLFKFSQKRHMMRQICCSSIVPRKSLCMNYSTANMYGWIIKTHMRVFMYAQRNTNCLKRWQRALSWQNTEWITVISCEVYL